MGRTLTAVGVTPVPTAPLLVAIDRIVEQGNRTLPQLAADCGTSARRIYAWRHGGEAFALPETVDRVLTRLGLMWWEVYDEDVDPEAYRMAEAAFG